MGEKDTLPISRRKPDPLADFCSELAEPLEEVFGLIYLASHAKENPTDSERYLNLATEHLAKVREVVLSHCNQPTEECKAS